MNTEPEGQKSQTKFIFQTTSIWKLVGLSIITLGLYNIIWAYNLWKSLKTEANYNINPFWRSVLINFTNFFLFPEINKYIERHGEKGFPPILFASIYFLINITAQRLPDFYWLIWFANIYVLVNIQTKINKLNLKFYTDIQQNIWNRKNTIWSIILIVFWGIIVFLLLM